MMIKETETMHIPVFLSSDDNYAPFAATAIASICYNTKSFIDFYILDGGISEINKGQINSLKTQFNNFALEFIKIDTNKLFKEFKNDGYITLSTYNRFLIPQLKPDLDKVIYLDVDIVALGDIAALYNEDLSGYSLAAVPDRAANSIELIKRNKFSMDISAEHTYFNAGVLLLDIQKWHNDNIVQRLFDIEKSYRVKVIWHDQDILNKCFDCNYQILDNKYNFMTASEKEIKPTQNIIIRHFTTTSEPWNRNDVYGEATINHLNDFWFYASMTPFLLTLQRAIDSSSGEIPKYANKLLTRREIISLMRRNIIQQQETP